MMPKRLLALFLGSTLLAVAAVAQNPLSGLRQKAALNDDDRTTMRTWIRDTVNAVIAEARGGQPAPGIATLRGLAADSSDAFKTAFAESAAQVIADALRGAPDGVAARLVTVLYPFDDPGAVRLYVAALGDPRDAVRICGASGLRRLAPKIAARGAADVNATLTTLRDAGRTEQSATVLDNIYRAMDYTRLPNAPESRANIAAVLELVQARAATYEVDKPVAAKGVDRAGVRLLAGQSAALDAEQRRRVLTAVGRMLRYCVWRYTTDESLQAGSGADVVKQRNELELFIADAEAGLRALGVGSADAPNIADAGHGAPAVAEMNKWAELLRGPTGEDFSLTSDSPAPAAESDGG